MSTLLIDAGKSRRGWSRIGQFTKCPQLFAYTNRLDVPLIPASALTRGSMGHVIQAHQHAIWGAEQGGVLVDTSYHDDPSVFMEPHDALVAWCDANGGHEFVERMFDVFDNYMVEYPEPPGRVLAVEWPMDAVIGKKEGQWGLWVIDPDEADKVDQRVETILAYDRKLIEVTPLNMPGHLDHGKPIYVSRRCDMVVEEAGGQVFIWDHKHQARVSQGKSIEGYAIDGGFALFRHMGQQVYGDAFGGLRLNLIQTTTPHKIARPTVPRTPHRDTHLAQMLWHSEHQIASMDMNMPDLWQWPKAMHETTCVGRYGSCGGIKLCYYGEAGKRYLG
jgi:hypothetical protein